MSIESLIINNKDQILNDYIDDINLIKENIEEQKDLVLLYAKVAINDPYAEEYEFTKSGFTAIYKNCLSLYCALEMTLLGLYGPARMIFRNIFEYLIISKKVSIISDNTLLNKWENGDRINFKNLVFKNVEKLQSYEVNEFWDTLNKFTHGTIFSGQIALNYNDIKDEIKFNIVCIKMLLDMNYHLMNSCIANRSIQYYAKSVLDLDEKGVFKNTKIKIKNNIYRMRKSLLKEPKKVVLDFISKWDIKK